MPGTAAYKIIQLAVLAIFAVAVSDLRRKPGMVLLIDRRVVLVMKLFYPVPMIIFGYTVAVLRQVHLPDLIALPLTLVGTALVVAAKLHLGKQHSWTGYRIKGTRLVTNGIYSCIRHPLYTGVALTAAGGLTTVIAHQGLALSIVNAVFLTFILGFLFTTACRETRLLEADMGEEYAAYRRQVHPFLPIRRFRQTQLADPERAAESPASPRR